MEFLWICIAIFLIVGIYIALRVARNPTAEEEEEMIAPQKPVDSWTLDSVDETPADETTLEV